MAKRERRVVEADKPAVRTSYFTGEKANFQFVSTGCTLLDCALGGGFPVGRIANIVGDKSTAKTALSTEVLINFIKTYKGKAAYRDAEAAFDRDYAAEMGLPLDDVDFGDKDIVTVEDFIRDFEKFLDGQQKGAPGIYVLDSLDALSDEAEMEQDVGKGTYGMSKPKMLSAFFRKNARRIEDKKVLLLIVSQVRDNIGALFGEKYKRSGGKALDFYASQCLWLAHIKTLKRTLAKVERPCGVTVRGKIKKNKIGLAFREADFDFIFGFGIDDVGAAVRWLQEVGRLKDAKITDPKTYLKELDELTPEEYASERENLSKLVKSVWAEIETSFLPTRRKYT